jgi:hypothetical protein
LGTTEQPKSTPTNISMNHRSFGHHWTAKIYTYKYQHEPAVQWCPNDPWFILIFLGVDFGCSVVSKWYVVHYTCRKCWSCSVDKRRQLYTAFCLSYFPFFTCIFFYINYDRHYNETQHTCSLSQSKEMYLIPWMILETEIVFLVKFTPTTISMDHISFGHHNNSNKMLYRVVFSCQQNRINTFYKCIEFQVNSFDSYWEILIMLKQYPKFPQHTCSLSQSKEMYLIPWMILETEIVFLVKSTPKTISMDHRSLMICGPCWYL